MSSEIEGTKASQTHEEEAAEGGAPSHPPPDVNGKSARSETRPSTPNRGGRPRVHDYDELDRRVLALIFEHEPTSYSDLCARLGVGYSTIHKSIARLRAAGKVTPGLGNRRGFIIAIKGD